MENAYGTGSLFFFNELKGKKKRVQRICNQDKFSSSEYAVYNCLDIFTKKKKYLNFKIYYKSEITESIF